MVPRQRPANPPSKWADTWDNYPRPGGYGSPKSSTNYYDDDPYPRPPHGGAWNDHNYDPGNDQDPGHGAGGDHGGRQPYQPPTQAEINAAQHHANLNTPIPRPPLGQNANTRGQKVDASKAPIADPTGSASNEAAKTTTCTTACETDASLSAADPTGQLNPPGPSQGAIPQPKRHDLGDGTYYHPGDGSIRDAAGHWIGSASGRNSGGDALVTVGRWMSTDEYQGMVNTGMVQAGAGDRTFVVYPASPNAYVSARPGSVYVEFDVPQSLLSPGGRPGDYKLSGPGSLDGRLAARKGLPLPQLPAAVNIRLGGSR
ncbi:TreTu family toxin [Fodinicola feengrottensis]|uniref:TreTu toxin C-terminal domain-containing protein n=1 Tax=Fodinicola feengrottensis TaxID=435914 RepID=A0ABN2J370_9ACTN